jgi:hypothetical protein
MPNPFEYSMNDDESSQNATPLSASALVLQDGTIVTLAAGRRETRSYGLLAVRLVSASWRRALKGAAAGIVLGFAAFAMMDKSYDATTVIESSPVSASMELQGKISGALGGGVQSLLGGPSAMPQMTKDFLQLLDSNVVSVALLKDPVVRANMFPDEWDSKTQTWHKPPGAIAALRLAVKNLFGGAIWAPPNPEAVKDYLESHLTIAPLGDGSIQQLTIESEDPQWSAYLLSHTVKAADNYLRVREAKRSGISIDYWQKQLDKAGAQDTRAALIANIVDAERRVVFAGVDVPFAIDIVDPVLVPNVPSGPSLWRTLLVWALLGVLLSFVPVLYRNLRAYWRRALPQRDEYSVYDPSSARPARYPMPLSAMARLWQRLFHGGA